MNKKRKMNSKQKRWSMKTFAFALVATMGIIFASNTIVSHAEINVPNATPKTGYHFEYEETMDEYVNVKPVEEKDYYPTSCIHNNCSIHTNQDVCHVKHAAYFVYCKDCYDKYGVELGLIMKNDEPADILYYPMYADFGTTSNPEGIDENNATDIGYGTTPSSFMQKAKKYLAAIESIYDNNGKNVATDNELLGIPSRLKNGDVYRFPCYNSQCGRTCNQHVTWNHRHLTEVPNTYTIIYDSNNASGAMPNTYMTYDEEGSLHENLFKKEHYVFKGWAVSSTDAKNGIVTYKDQAVVKNLTSEDGAYIYLYAVWSPAPVRLTIDPNGGKYNGLTGLTFINGMLPGESSSVTNAVHSNQDKNFEKWTVVEGDATITEDGQVVMGVMNSTIKASWNGPLSLNAKENWTSTQNGKKGAVDLIWNDDVLEDYITTTVKLHKHDGNETTGGKCYSLHIHDGSEEKEGRCYTTYTKKKVKCGNLTTYFQGTCGCWWDEANNRCVRCHGTNPNAKVHYGEKCSKCGSEGYNNQTNNFENMVHYKNKKVWNLTCTKPAYELSCGKEEGDVDNNGVAAGYTATISYHLYGKESSAAEYSKLKQYTAGEKWADTDVEISLEHLDLKAYDKAAPGPVVDLKVSPTYPTGSNMKAVWTEAKDTGTTYEYYVDAVNPNTNSVLKTTSNEIDFVNLTSGIKEYRYIWNNDPNHEIIDDEEGFYYTTTDTTVDFVGNFTAGKTTIIGLYLHVAAVDNAGNVGPTSHCYFTENVNIVAQAYKPYMNGYGPVAFTYGVWYKPYDSKFSLTDPAKEEQYAKQLEGYSVSKIDYVYKYTIGGTTYTVTETVKDFKETILPSSTRFTARYNLTINIYYKNYVSGEDSSKDYPVTYIDMDDEGNLLNYQNKMTYLGDTVAGSDLGKSSAIGAYYPRFKYKDCTTATVTKDGATVYRYFEGIKYNIEYQLNGGEEVVENPTIVKFGEEFTVTPPKKDGFEFVKWKISGMSNFTHTINGNIINPPYATTLEVYGNPVSNVAGNSPSTFMNLNEEEGTVQFYAVWQDVTEPEVEKVLTKKDGTSYKEDTWTDQDVKMTSTATDESGISNFVIKQTTPSAKTLVSKQPNTSPVTEVTIFTETGTYAGTITAEDNAGQVNDYTIVNPNGNLSTMVNFGPIKIDKLEPEGTIVYNPAIKTNKDVVVKVKDAKDLHSGLNTNAYSWDGGSTWTNVSEKTVTENNSGSVWIRDNVGNILKLDWKVDWMDKVSPQISVKEVKNGNEYQSTVGGKVEENTTIKKYDTNSWYRNASYSWINKDIEKDGYIASGIKSVLLQKGSDASFSTASTISSNVLQQPTKLGEEAVLNSAIEAEGRNYFRVVTKDAVGNTTTASYQINIDKTGVSINDGMSSISIGSLDTLTGEEIQYNLENGVPFTSEFRFFLYDATQADKQANGLPLTSDSSGIRSVYMYLYDANEESAVSNLLTSSYQSANYTLTEEEEMQNLASFLTSNKGNLFNMTDSKTATTATVSGSGIYSGYYSAVIDTYATYPESSCLRYALVCYDNAGNRSVYTMPSGAVIENFSVKANIYSSVGEEFNTPSEDGTTNIPYFKTGDMGHVDIWTLGYVEGVSFDFLEVGKESANAITRGDLLAKYNLGCDISGYERTISADKSVQIENGMPIVGGLSYANHYMYTVDGWLTEGVLVRIPPTYDLKVDASQTDDEGDETYIYQTHNAKITAIKGDLEVTVFAPYVLYSTSREGIHYRTTHEYGQ